MGLLEASQESAPVAMIKSPASTPSPWVLAELRGVIDVEVAADDGRDVGLSRWGVAARVAQDPNHAIDVVFAMQTQKMIALAVAAVLRKVQMHRTCAPCPCH